MFRSYYVLWCISYFFCYRANPDKMVSKHNKFLIAEKIMPYHISPNGSAGGRFPLYAVLWRHKAFIKANCVRFQLYFAPSIFLRNLVSTFVYISPTRLKKHYLDLGLKSHTGATQTFTRVRESCFAWRKLVGTITLVTIGKTRVLGYSVLFVEPYRFKNYIWKRHYCR